MAKTRWPVTSQSFATVSRTAAQNQPRLAGRDDISGVRSPRSLELDAGPAGPVEGIFAERARRDLQRDVAGALRETDGELLQGAIIDLVHRVEEALVQDDRL